MKTAKYLLCAVALFAAGTVYATEKDTRFVQKLKLSADQTAVVAEGDLEARSIGSYSVRLYSTENAQPDDDTTFFTAGVVHERDGFIEKIALADIDNNGRDELVVIIRSAGTGGYRSAHAFSFQKNKTVLVAAVADILPDRDPIAALKMVKKKHK
jgi:hypothetical protein